MSRRNQLTLLGAGLATALAACHTSTPTTSVSALSYQVRSADQRSAASTVTATTCSAPAQPSRKTVVPAETSPNDPLRLFDLP